MSVRKEIILQSRHSYGVGIPIPMFFEETDSELIVYMKNYYPNLLEESAFGVIGSLMISLAMAKIPYTFQERKTGKGRRPDAIRVGIADKEELTTIINKMIV